MRGNLNTKVGRLIYRNRTREIIEVTAKLNQEHEQKAQKLGLGWRLTSATILQRYPVVLPDSESWEIDYHKIKAKIFTYSVELFIANLKNLAHFPSCSYLQNIQPQKASILSVVFNTNSAVSICVSQSVLSNCAVSFRRVHY